MIKVFIYLLVDPRKPEVVRYVGQTKTPLSRQLQHCAESGRSAKCQWVEEMRMDGVLPQMLIAEQTTAEHATERERVWIARFRCDLLSNAQDPIPKEPVIVKVAPFAESICVVERNALITALEANEWNMSATAKAIGISRPGIYDKVQRLGIVKGQGKTPIPPAINGEC